MSITQEKRTELIAKFGGDAKNTGSTHAQVAVLTERIRSLTEHFKTHKKDNHSRRGLIRLVSNRRRLLNYLKKNDLEGYKKLIADLGLRK